MTSRRSFLLGLGSALAAPAIVRANSLMKLAVLRESVTSMSFNLLPPGSYQMALQSVTLDQFSARILDPAMNVLMKMYEEEFLYKDNNNTSIFNAH